MTRNAALCLLCFCLSVVNSNAQQTVGLFLNTQDAYVGYTLFAPNTSNRTYLINNCGQQVHSWTGNNRPGLSVYLLENGDLLRTQNLNNTTFTSGGKGGGIEILDWDGNVVWDYTISSTLECQHHDIEYLPNGNILAIVWDSKTNAEAIQAGRTTSGATLWSEKIVEIQPDLVNGGGTIVWQWNAWDHLVQDVNNSLDNFGDVGASPELININYTSGNPTNSDWLHINSVDYNAQLDQIVLSIHNFSEFWIIDHSTTTLEAAGHTGGNSGKGGDLLYRWGNPQTYNQGTAADQILYLQHDARWIENGMTDSGMIMVFNNQAGSPADYSQVNVIETPVDLSGNYTYSGGAYGPAAAHWTYQAATPTDFYASNISGAQRLPNGNTLICNGPAGEFFEVDYSGTTVWRYVNPVAMGGIIVQNSPATQNIVFRCTRYPVTFPGFTGHTLTPMGYIETGSAFACDTFPTAVAHYDAKAEMIIAPNPASGQVTISFNNTIKQVHIFNTLGQLVIYEELNKAQTVINISMLPAGMYYALMLTDDGERISQKMQVVR